MSRLQSDVTRVLSIIGTRPEAIKMAPVIKALERYPDRLTSIVCVTGQHKELLDEALALFDIRPDRDLGVMVPGQTLARLTAKLIQSLEETVEDTRPNWIVAQGDTTSVLAASFVAFYNHVSFGHIEAGLRTGDLAGPFPEEMNRRVADLVSTALFAPTEVARASLLSEGVPAEKIHVTGNTVVDALLDIAARRFDWVEAGIAHLEKGRTVLVTAHRRESVGPALREMCGAIRDLAQTFSAAGVNFVFPMHLNPGVRTPVKEILGGLSNVSLVEHLDYLRFVHLMKHSELILTDSGGIQEEAPTFGVPVLVMRDKTERPEGVDAGVSRVVGTSRESIVSQASYFLAKPRARSQWPIVANPYGDGKAAERIVSVLLASA